MRCYDESLEIFERLQDPAALFTLMMLSDVHYLAGDSERAYEVAHELIARAEQIGDPQLVSFAYLQLYMVDAYLGDNQRSWDRLEQDTAMWAATGAAFWAAVGQATLGLRWMVEGELDRAAESLEPALISLREQGQFMLLPMLVAAVWVERGRQRPDAARRYLAEALAYGRPRHPAFFAWPLSTLAAMLVDEDRLERAVQLAALATRLRETRDMDLVRDSHDQRLARARAALGDERFAELWAKGVQLDPHDLPEVDELCERYAPSSAG